MKKFLVILMVIAVASFLFVGCLGVTPDVDEDEDVVVTIAAIPGVTAPVTGATPVTTITATAQYTGVVTWLPVATTFAAETAYTATITLTPVTGYTLTGVAADFFTVADATTDTNPADSGVVTAVFPATAAAAVVPTSATPVMTAVQESDGTIIFLATATGTLYMNKIKAGSSILVTGTNAPSESSVQIYLDDVAIAGAVGEASVTGLWSVAVAESSLGADGVKTLHATVTEVGLAESAASNAVTFTFDTDLPGISSIACTANVTGTVTVATTVSGSVTGTNPLSALALSGTTGFTVVAGDYVIKAIAAEGGAVDNITITTPAGVTTAYNGVSGADTFDDVIPGIDITFATFSVGDGVTITNTAAVAAGTAIPGRATITFDEDVSHAGAAAGTYAGGLVSVDPTTYKPATDTGYWTDLTATSGATVTITVYGITDLAGNVGGTSTSVLTKSCTVGAASTTLLAP